MKASIGCTVVALGGLLLESGCVPKDGAGGGGGGPATPTAAASSLGACPATAMIEDGEDANNQVVAQDGRGGYMYTYLDKLGSTISPNSDSGEFTMTPGGANGSAQALRFQGQIGTGEVVYAGVGLNFVDPKGTYDASKYGGISFWAKGSGTVRMKVPDANTDPDGKVCTECFNDHGVEFSLGAEWQQFTYAFGDLKQEAGWGAPQVEPVDAAKIYGVQFQVNAKGQPYDVWIDDVQFVGCQ